MGKSNRVNYLVEDAWMWSAGSAFKRKLPPLDLCARSPQGQPVVQMASRDASTRAFCESFTVLDCKRLLLLLLLLIFFQRREAEQTELRDHRGWGLGVGE